MKKTKTNKIKGDNGDNVIVGTVGSDDIDGKGGDDTIHADAGNDKVKGGKGNDNLFGDSGKDLLLGGDGNDHLSGGTDDDLLDGGKGNDELLGDEGNDILAGNKGDDTLLGGDGDDVLLGDGKLKGSGKGWGSGGGAGSGDGTGKDSGSGSGGAGWNQWATVGGSGSGNNGEGSDYLDGGAGNDLLFAGGGNDTGHYQVTENVGSTDAYDGGDGIDTLELELTLDEWKDPAFQVDLASYLQFLEDHTDASSGEADDQAFTFNAFDLTASAWENLAVTVDGVATNPADEAVTANDDEFITDEDTAIIGNVLDDNGNGADEIPDFLSSISLVPGITAGALTLNPDGSFHYDPSGVFEHLAVGEFATDTFTYMAEDADGDTDTATVNIRVDGVNDAPTVLGSVLASSTEDDVPFSVDLLDGASDVDSSDILNVASLLLTSGNAAGVTIDVSGNSLLVDPNAYNHLAVGETESINYSYDVIDGNGGIVVQTATIDITGENDAPTVLGSVLASSTEDDVPFSVDLLDGASDVDSSDILNVASLLLTSGNAAGVTIDVSGNSLLVDPNAYNHLAEGETESINYSYDVIDGNGGIVAQTATIVITGINDTPVITASDNGSVDLFSGPPILMDSGSISFNDVDLGDIHSISSVTPSAGAFGVLTAVVSADTTGSGIGGIVDWDYTVSAAEPFAPGITTEYFDVTIANQFGDEITEQIEITIIG